MDADHLAKLFDLKQKGALTEAEFEAEKARLLAPSTAAPVPAATLAPTSGPRPWGMDLPAFLMLMNLSLFAGYILPFAGLVLPIVMWATCKDLSPDIDRCGRYLFNHLLSFLIWWFISIVLCFVLIGFALVLALGICAIVFPIIGAVKASRGVVWRYPLSIRFFG